MHGRGRGVHGGHVWQGGACMAGELGVRDRGRAWPEMATAAGGTHPTSMECIHILAMTTSQHYKAR